MPTMMAARSPSRKTSYIGTGALPHSGSGRAPGRRWPSRLSCSRRPTLASWWGCRMRRFETGQVLLDDGRDDREDDGRGQRDPEDDPEKCEHDRQERHYHYDDEHPSEWDRPMERSIGP